MNFIKRATIFCSIALIAGVAAAQEPAPAVSYSSISELNQMFSNLQQASEALQEGLSRLRIEKWKTDSGTKRQTQGNVDSILRNLQAALPEILAELKNSPEDGPLTFKVYRNLDALNDVLSSIVESAGAFGSREEFQSLSKDLTAIDDSRRVFAERMDKVAAAKETEIGQLRVALQNARSNAAPKKTVVDDTAPPVKKPTAARKKAAVPKPNTPAPQTQPASLPHQ